jgi:hypothetical protein
MFMSIAGDDAFFSGLLFSVATGGKTEGDEVSGEIKCWLFLVAGSIILAGWTTSSAAIVWRYPRTGSAHRRQLDVRGLGGYLFGASHKKVACSSVANGCWTRPGLRPPSFCYRYKLDKHYRRLLSLRRNWKACIKDALRSDGWAVRCIEDGGTNRVEESRRRAKRHTSLVPWAYRIPCT